MICRRLLTVTGYHLISYSRLETHDVFLHAMRYIAVNMLGSFILCRLNLSHSHPTNALKHVHRRTAYILIFMNEIHGDPNVTRSKEPAVGVNQRHQ